MMGKAEMPPVLDRSAVAELVGVEPDTITKYLHMSQPGGLYERRPFPAPDGRIGVAPYWLARRVPEIMAWANRPGRGRGRRQKAR